MKEKDIVDFVIKVEEISKVGLKYSTDPYARDNYQELQDTAKSFMESKMNTSFASPNFFKRDIYPTPNVSVRTIILSPDKKQVFLVQERLDSKFSFPGGWAELTLSPAESALKELREEAGYECKLTRLVGILDRYENTLTSGVPEYIIVFQGELVKKISEPCHEILSAGFYPLGQLPAWSKKHNVEVNLKMLKAAVEGVVVFD
jgi:8-oxo-dGTP diphosphatase